MMTGTPVVSCERGGPSCAAWLLGESDQPPDHVCAFVMAWSVERFIEQRAYGNWQDAFGGCWPLPVGAKSIAECPTSPNRGVVLWAIHDWVKRGDETTFAIRAQPNPAIEIPAWYTPLVTKPDAYAGLVAERHAKGAGRVWLLGLVESKGEGTWVWAQSEILIEASPTKPGELTKLSAEADKLLGWYGATLLGKEFKPGVGRPKGSKEYWRDREDFIAAVRAAINALEAEKRSITQDAVAGYLANTNLRVPRSNPTGKSSGYSLDQFKRDRKDYGFPQWEDLKNLCTN